MIIDGEKWACEACVRGHRVSNCQHHDRPLQHINKKGRPVSQCQHCRSMRKSRSSHVKCDCGEKTHKCIHLQPTLEGHKDSCCCNHGGRCTCSHKKDSPSLDTVPESDSDREVATQSKSIKGGSRSRRRANTTSSDGMLSFDANGHHKPTYKHTKVHQKTGPYQLNRVNSLHSTGNRSVDNLLGSSNESGGSKSPSRSNSGGGMSMTQAQIQQRRVKSEAASPLMTGTSPSFSQLPPLDLSGIKYPSYVPNSADFFGSMSDHEQPMFSAGLSAVSVDWSHYDGLEFANKATDFAPSSYSQPQSYCGGFDYSGSEQVTTLTTNTSTSGEVSEVEDFLPNTLDEFDTHSTANDNVRNGNTGCCSSGFNLSHTQASLLGSTDLTGIDFDDFKYMKAASNRFLQTPSSFGGEEQSLTSTAINTGYNGFSSLEDDPAFWMDSYTSGMPNLTDSPAESSLPASLWDTQ
ncbi:hypothetical protein QBC46DRAFT_249282 [Diplogelasinospora grovesii]|uniref:Copper-fist domain-containing protein n=1 Tax=Diplogelasinospora grovesii TaxID=303347 RepID=A0AAN6NIB2_9PEZI|nr:hypothetical protein QBC46DRAFT_249282 [Diplogelasinospora grovesii]